MKNDKVEPKKDHSLLKIAAHHLTKYQFIADKVYKILTSPTCCSNTVTALLE